MFLTGLMLGYIVMVLPLLLSSLYYIFTKTKLFTVRVTMSTHPDDANKRGSTPACHDQRSQSKEPNGSKDSRAGPEAKGFPWFANFAGYSFTIVVVSKMITWQPEFNNKTSSERLF